MWGTAGPLSGGGELSQGGQGWSTHSHQITWGLEEEPEELKAEVGVWAQPWRGQVAMAMQQRRLRRRPTSSGHM